MNICVTDKIILIYFNNNDELRLVKNHFTVDDRTYAFVGGKFDSRKIKKKTFLKKKKQYYYLNSGFLHDLLIFIRKKKLKVEEFVDKRTKFPYQKKQLTDDELKKFLPDFNYVEHQISSLKKMLKTNVGIVEAPTSAGKTEIFIAFIKLTKLPTLILVNRINLAMQTVERMEKNGIKSVGICYGGGVKDGDVMVSTIGSVKKIPNFRKYKILIIDEVHRASAGQFQEFLSMTSYPIRFGFSATPNSGNELKWSLIRQFIGNIIYSIEPEVLIEKEVIAKPTIEFLSVPCPPTLDWPSANWNCIVNNGSRNNKIKKLVDKFNLPTLILIRNIDHGEILNEKINGSVFVSGIDDAEERKDVIHKFEDGDLNVVIASNIFNEGISINAIKLLIIASGGKSKIEAMQKIGRGLRVHEHKKEVLVFDFNDEGNYFTEKHSRIRKNIYKKAGFEVI